MFADFFPAFLLSLSDLQMSLAHCRVVLVRPRFAANIGAAARVMRNMGLRDLFVVAPEADLNDREARRLSTHGEFILDQAQVVATLDEALGDCLDVIGTSARAGRLIRGNFGLPEQILPYLWTCLEAGSAALVFGPETNGLRDDELSRCRHVLHIPTDSEYPALNLAQAVAITLYELRRQWLWHRHSCRCDQESAPAESPAAFAVQERMFADLRTALAEIHFLYGPKADTLMHGLRHLISRAQPTESEVGILFGLARQIRWFVSQKSEVGGQRPEFGSQKSESEDVP
jgi:tRNA/rRNA methyltransferase